MIKDYYIDRVEGMADLSMGNGSEYNTEALQTIASLYNSEGILTVPRLRVSGECELEGKTTIKGGLDSTGTLVAKNSLILGEQDNKSWGILRLPDGSLTINPRKEDNSAWDIERGMLLSSDGDKMLMEVKGSVLSRDNLRVGPKTEKEWVFHVPDDSRNSLYIAPRNSNGNGWNWGRQLEFDNSKGDYLHARLMGSWMSNSEFGAVLTDGDARRGNIYASAFALLKLGKGRLPNNDPRTNGIWLMPGYRLTIWRNDPGNAYADNTKEYTVENKTGSEPKFFNLDDMNKNGKEKWYNLERTPFE